MPKTTRRGFIQVALGAAAALTAPAILPGVPPGITTPIGEVFAAGKRYMLRSMVLDYESSGGPAILSVDLDGKPLMNWIVSGESIGREQAQIRFPPDTIGRSLRFEFRAKGDFTLYNFKTHAIPLRSFDDEPIVVGGLRTPIRCLA